MTGRSWTARMKKGVCNPRRAARALPCATRIPSWAATRTPRWWWLWRAGSRAPASRCSASTAAASARAGARERGCATPSARIARRRCVASPRLAASTKSACTPSGTASAPPSLWRPRSASRARAGSSGSPTRSAPGPCSCPARWARRKQRFLGKTPSPEAASVCGGRNDCVGAAETATRSRRRCVPLRRGASWWWTTPTTPGAGSTRPSASTSWSSWESTRKRRAPKKKGGGRRVVVVRDFRDLRRRHRRRGKSLLRRVRGSTSVRAERTRAGIRRESVRRESLEELFPGRVWRAHERERGHGRLGRSALRIPRVRIASAGSARRGPLGASRRPASESSRSRFLPGGVVAGRNAFF